MKMLRSKNIRRICVLLAMLAPVVYLFGSLFAGLTGAHGEQVYAEPEYVEQYVEVDYASTSYGYVVIGSDVDPLDYLYLARNVASNVFDFTFNGVDYARFGTAGSSDTFIGFDIFTADNERLRLGQYTRSSTADSWVFGPFAPFPWTFYGDDLVHLNGIPNAKYYSVASLPSDTTPVNPGANSDYIFKNFFAKDNFLVEWGRNAISETPYGFAPFGAFWRYLDLNVLHLSNDQIGLMGYGYIYYACHVLLFDVGFILVTFFLDFIQKVNDKIVGGVD